MQIVYHIGANCTDDDRLLKSLLKNADAFLGQGIAVPGPSRYRAIIRETIQNLNGTQPANDTRNILLDAILDDAEADRLVMSHHAFISIPTRIFENGIFYGLAEQKIQGLVSLFPSDEIELFIGIRNPATFIPAVYSHVNGLAFQDFLKGVHPTQVRWSDLISRVQALCPKAQLNVWCNEDTPLIWAQLIREMSGVDPVTKISGGFDLLSKIMTAEGMTRFHSYLKSHPPQTEIQKRRIIAAFLDKYVIEDEVEEEFDLPGWTEDMVDELTELYEEDLFTIEKMPGVNFITP
jgi:hypothetical protein